MGRRATNCPRSYVSARSGKRSLIRLGFRWEGEGRLPADSALRLLGFCGGIVHALGQSFRPRACILKQAIKSEGEVNQRRMGVVGLVGGFGVSLDDAETQLAAQEAQLVDQIARREHRRADEGALPPLREEPVPLRAPHARRRRAGRGNGAGNLPAAVAQRRAIRRRPGSVGAFLFVIARSAAADIRKRPSSRQLLPVDDFQLPPLPDSTDQILDSLILREALDKLTLPMPRCCGWLSKRGLPRPRSLSIWGWRSAP